MLMAEAARKWLEDHMTESIELRQIRRRLDEDGWVHHEMFVSQIALLRSLLATSDLRRVLELGTYVGYSTQAFVEIIDNMGGGVITTVECDGDAVTRARRNVSSSELTEVNFIVATAESVCDDMKRKGQVFDLIFLDVAESAYPGLYDPCVELLRPGGVLVIDNVLMETIAGWSNGLNVVEQHTVDGGVNSTLEALSQLLERMFTDSRVAASVVPLGSGVAVCTRTAT